jgi:hypothetical protein
MLWKKRTNRRACAVRGRRRQPRCAGFFEALERRDLMAAVPIFESLPSAAATLYLDFDGHFEPSWGSYSNIVTPVYDSDGDPAAFSTAELTLIENVWKIVAEDFAPFNINVTTKEPAVLAADVPIEQANRLALRVAIGGSSNDWYHAPAGGVGYTDAFTNDVANTAYVFTQNSSGGSNSTLAVAGAASHEAGHCFGLNHQSQYNAAGDKTAEYLPSSGIWSAIMGRSSNLDLNTWHNGTSALGPTVFQDDIAVIASATNGFGFRADDHGDTLLTAAPLVGTEPNWTATGIVGAMSDVDMFSFTTTQARELVVTIDGNAPGQNLDAVLEIYQADGSLLDSVNPSDSLDAIVVRTFSPGTHYVAVRSNGQYGRIGQYSLSIAPLTAGGIFEASDGDDLFYVTQSSDGAALEIFNTNPPVPGATPLFTWPMVSASPLRIDMRGGQDIVIVDLPGDNGGLLGGFEVEMGSGFDQFFLIRGGATIDVATSGGQLHMSVLGEAHLATHRLTATRLSVGDGGKVTLLPDGQTSLISELSLSPGATLDIGNNALVIDYSGQSPAPSIREWILGARIGGGLGATWTGPGITSSSAAALVATSPEQYSVAYAENADLPLGAYSIFRGVTIDETALLIAYTRTGDANLDGLVNDDDATILGATYALGVAQEQWSLADFDFNGFVDDDDATLLGAFYEQAASQAASPGKRLGRRIA